MTIRQRIRLTGSIAVTSILLLLAWILIQHIQSWQSQRQTHADLASFDAWIKVVHQLQNERGTLTTELLLIYLAVVGAHGAASKWISARYGVDMKEPRDD